MTEAARVPTPVASRRRLVAARTLTVLAVLLSLVSVLANYVKREMLDESWFRGTSRDLIADPAIQAQLSTTLVDQLYANVDVAAALRQRLPDNMDGLAGPIAGGVRDVMDRSARRLLQGPRVQDLFVTAASTAQQQFVAVLNGDKRIVQTRGGKVVLDVRPLVLSLGSRFSFIPDLDSRIPPGSARVVILESDELKSAQDATRLLRFLADWIWVLVLAAAAGAVWLARGRRRLEVRALAIGILVTGFLILVVRTLAGRYLVDHLVTSESVKPAVASAYEIITDLLRGDGRTALIIGLIALLGVWLCGPGRHAVTTRRVLAPYLRRPGLTFGGFAVLYLLLLWWEPTPQFGFARSVLVFFLLGLLGVEVLRRQAARDFPHAEPVDLGAALRQRFARDRAPVADATDELERLARLHSEGSLDDTEFAAAKAQVLTLQ